MIQVFRLAITIALVLLIKRWGLTPAVLSAILWMWFTDPSGL